MSLLLANGHVDAMRYPIGLVWTEAALVRERLNTEFATQATLTKMAVSANISEGGAKQFREQVEALLEGG